MRLTLRTMALAIGSTWMIGTSAAQAQTPPAYYYYYYPAPGDYASAFGTVHIPAAGYYYNAAPYAVPAPRYAAPAYATPAPGYSAPAPAYATPTLPAPSGSSDYNAYMQSLYGGG